MRILQTAFLHHPCWRREAGKRRAVGGVDRRVGDNSILNPLTLARIKKRRKILKKSRNYDKVRCRDELAFPALRKEAHEVGKGPSGKECGKGICRRKDGKLSAGYPARNGARREKRFDPLPKARSWLAGALHEDKRAVWRPSCEMTEDWSFEHQNRHGSLAHVSDAPYQCRKQFGQSAATASENGALTKTSAELVRKFIHESPEIIANKGALK